MRYLLCMILAMSFLVAILGCDEDNQPREEKLKVDFFPYSSGVPLDSPLYATFNRKVVSATILIDGIPVEATTDDNRMYTIPEESIISIIGLDTSCIPDATDKTCFELTILAEDETGQNLEYTTPYCILISDAWWPPSICGSKCIPKNDAVGIDPEDFSGKVVIAFNQRILEVEILSIEPEFGFTYELIEDDMKMEVKFLNYTMLYGAKYEIRLSADAWGDPYELLYSFETMSGRES